MPNGELARNLRLPQRGPPEDVRVKEIERRRLDLIGLQLPFDDDAPTALAKHDRTIAAGASKRHVSRDPGVDKGDIAKHATAEDHISIDHRIRDGDPVLDLRIGEIETLGPSGLR